MLREGKISPCKSPFGTAILFVRKPSGHLEPVVAYRELHKVMIHNKYLISLMMEVSDQVGLSEIFTK